LFLRLIIFLDDNDQNVPSSHNYLKNERDPDAINTKRKIVHFDSSAIYVRNYPDLKLMQVIEVSNKIVHGDGHGRVVAYVSFKPQELHVYTDIHDQTLEKQDFVNLEWLRSSCQPCQVCVSPQSRIIGVGCTDGLWLLEQ
jgi:hypothetical protein